MVLRPCADWNSADWCQVFASFFIQSAIALLTASALIALASWPRLRTATRELHIRRVLAATVDFHKAQCYFSSTIQITALILYSQSIRAYARVFGRKFYTNKQYDLTDLADLSALAFTALIPNALTLSCIAKYGRQSWYLIIISFITMVLGTATWGMSIQSIHIIYKYARHAGPYYEFQNYIDIDKCSIDGNYSQILYSLCGSEYTERQTRAINEFEDGKTGFTGVAFYIAWLVSVLSILVCVWDKVASHYQSTLFAQKLQAATRNPRVRTFLTASALILWPFCFAAQFYYYYTYFKMGYVSKFWSFGQIISVSVWVPSLVEFAYIQYSKHILLRMALLHHH